MLTKRMLSLCFLCSVIATAQDTEYSQEPAYTQETVDVESHAPKARNPKLRAPQKEDGFGLNQINQLQNKFKPSAAGFEVVKQWLSKGENGWRGVLEFNENRMGQDSVGLMTKVLQERPRESDESRTLNKITAKINMNLREKSEYGKDLRQQILDGKIKPATAQDFATAYVDVFAYSFKGKESDTVVANIGGYLMRINSRYDEQGVLRSRSFEPVHAKYDDKFHSKKPDEYQPNTKIGEIFTVKY